MSLDVLRATAREMVVQLALGDYEAVIRRCVKSRLSSDDLRTVIRDYRRKLAPPPAGAYDNLDAVQLKVTPVPTWSVRAPLWTEEEGHSDLTLELTISLSSGAPSVELDDLRVL